MKKLISTVMAITICCITLSVFPTSAADIYCDGIRLERCILLEDYDDSSCLIYRAVTPYSTGVYKHIYCTTEHSSSFGSFMTNIFQYELTVDEAEVLKLFIEENYPKITIDEIIDNDITIGYKLVSEDELTFEEQMSISMVIKENLGLSWKYYYLADIVDVQFIGDLTSDNALTPVDASMLLSYYADAQSGVAVASAESDADYSVLGDFNGDGAVTPTDASEILSYYADQQTA